MQLQKLEEMKDDSKQHFSIRVRQDMTTQTTKKFVKKAENKVEWELINSQKKMAKYIYSKYGEGHWGVFFRSGKKDVYSNSKFKVQNPKKYVQSFIYKPKYISKLVKRAELIIYAKYHPNGVVDKDNFTFKWITHDDPTKKNKSGRKDKMYMFKKMGWMDC